MSHWVSEWTKASHLQNNGFFSACKRFSTCQLQPQIITLPKFSSDVLSDAGAKDTNVGELRSLWWLLRIPSPTADPSSAPLGPALCPGGEVLSCLDLRLEISLSPRGTEGSGTQREEGGGVSSLLSLLLPAVFSCPFGSSTVTDTERGLGTDPLLPRGLCARAGYLNTTCTSGSCLLRGPDGHGPLSLTWHPNELRS